MTAECRACLRPLVQGESAWASDWTVIDAAGVRLETRYACRRLRGNVQ